MNFIIQLPVDRGPITGNGSERFLSKSWVRLRPIRRPIFSYTFEPRTLFRKLVSYLHRFTFNNWKNEKKRLCRIISRKFKMSHESLNRLLESSHKLIAKEVENGFVARNELFYNFDIFVFEKNRNIRIFSLFLTLSFVSGTALSKVRI